MSWLPTVRAHRASRAFTAVADSATDVLYPLVVLGRGTARLARSARGWWAGTPKDRRGPTVFLGAACALVVALTPYGPWLALLAAVGAAAWHGRDQSGSEEPAGPTEEQTARLQALYDAVAPHFCPGEDPHPQPLYTPDGTWERAFAAYEFSAQGRVERLELRYPPYFPDDDLQARARVQHVLSTKAGRNREYHFGWDEENNHLQVTALPALPTGIHAQQFATAPSETVLGFTDPQSVPRTIPVIQDGAQLQLPPAIWRTGPHSTESHLLALGTPGSGTTTLLRTVALQALHHGEVVVIDGSGEGEYGFLVGREGVLAVETTPVGALAALEWAAHEAERRLRIARAPGAAVGAPRPLWILADRVALLSHLARAEGRADPQDLLEVPLRHGRAAQVTVALADQLDGAGEGLSQPVRACTRARVVLGEASGEQLQAVLGQAHPTSPPAHSQPGRGYARLGSGPVLRLQVPHTPNPFDDTAPEGQRAAVEALLPTLAVS